MHPMITFARHATSGASNALARAVLRGAYLKYEGKLRSLGIDKLSLMKTKSSEHPRYTLRGYVEQKHVWAAHYKDDALKDGEIDNWESGGKPYCHKTHWKLKL